MATDRMSGMETFVHVVEAGSFSGAARLLDVGQPAVSKAIAQLEQRLGVRLLHRTTRGLTPTDAGQRFYAQAKIAIDQVDAAELAARGSDGVLAGRLRVSAAVTFAGLHVIPLLKPFLAQHPQLDIDLVLDDRNVDLLAHGIDVALRLGDQADSRMTARRLGQARRMVVATPAYLAQAGAPRSPAELAGKDLVVYDTREGGNVWTFTDAVGVMQSITLSGRIRTTAGEGIKAALMADLGLAIVSEWMIGPELQQGRIKQVLADWTLPALDLWAVFPAGRGASPKARAFIGWLEQHLPR